jgi:hypothetical protein
MDGWMDINEYSLLRSNLKTCMRCLKNIHATRHWWLTPVILATQRQRSGGLWFQARPGKLFARPYLTIKGWWSGLTYSP